LSSNHLIILPSIVTTSVLVLQKPHFAAFISCTDQVSLTRSA